MDPCYSNASQEACIAAQGLPSGTDSSYGTADPENNVIGMITGGSFYFRTSTSKLYVFGGTPRTSVGWVILN